MDGQDVVKSRTTISVFRPLGSSYTAAIQVPASTDVGQGRGVLRDGGIGPSHSKGFLTPRPHPRQRRQRRPRFRFPPVRSLQLSRQPVRGRPR